MKLNWEWALLLLLVLEILLFGTLNPRMLDINMLLFSTSDFICIGIVALPLTLVIISGGIDISLGSTIGLCAIALGVMMQSGVPMAAAIPLTLLPWYTLPLRRRGAAALGHGRGDRLRRHWWFPGELHGLCQSHGYRAADPAGAVRDHHLYLLADYPSRALWPPSVSDWAESARGALCGAVG